MRAKLPLLLRRPQHHSGSGPSPPIRRRRSQHHSCPDSGASALRRGGKPSGGIRGRHHGQRLVRRLEAGRGRNFVRPYRQRVFLARRGAQPFRLPPRHHSSGAVRVRCRSDLFVQCRFALRARGTAPLRSEFQVAGHPCPVRRVPLRFGRHPSRRQSGAGRHAGIRFRG